MNTPRDTDERRARPSVWPVYVVAALLGSLGLFSVAIGAVLLFFSPGHWRWGLGYFVPVGVFDIVVAYGLLRLRRWGWWCGIVWLCYGVLCSLWIVLSKQYMLVDTGPPAPLSGIVIALLTAGLAVWILATRRQLFFPPKQAGRE